MHHLSQISKSMMNWETIIIKSVWFNNRIAFNNLPNVLMLHSWEFKIIKSASKTNNKLKISILSAIKLYLETLNSNISNRVLTWSTWVTELYQRRLKSSSFLSITWDRSWLVMEDALTFAKGREILTMPLFKTTQAFWHHLSATTFLMSRCLLKFINLKWQ